MTADDEGGFTLIEAVIAIMVISIAVVTLVGGLVSMIQLTQAHRGHAVAEAAARSFGQAVVATAQSSAGLASGVSASATSITVEDASTLPPAGASSYLLLDREVIRLSAVDRTTGVLTVARAQGGTTGAAHSADAAVVPLLRCPTASQLTPPAGAYEVATGVTPTITAVEYLDSTTGAFTSTSAGSCLARYEELCPAPTLLPECGTGYFRVSVSVSTAGDSRLRNVAATTRVLVRSGSA